MNNTHWDKRSWLLAFGGGTVCGALDGLVTSWQGKEVLTRSFPHELHGMPIWEVVSVLFTVAGLLALPIFVSATARSRYLLWGLIPVWLTWLGIAVRDTVQGDTSSLKDSGLFFLALTAASLLLTCGPVSLYRFLRQRKAQRLAALQQAMQDAQAPQEGVWPPPPRFLHP